MLPMKGQIRRNLYFKESVRCLWEFSKNLIVENTPWYVKGTPVNAHKEEVESLKVYLVEKVLFHHKFSMHFSLVDITWKYSNI